MLPLPSLGPRVKRTVVWVECGCIVRVHGGKGEGMKISHPLKYTGMQLSRSTKFLTESTQLTKCKTCAYIDPVVTTPDA